METVRLGLLFGIRTTREIVFLAVQLQERVRQWYDLVHNSTVQYELVRPAAPSLSYRTVGPGVGVSWCHSYKIWKSRNVRSDLEDGLIWCHSYKIWKSRNVRFGRAETESEAPI